MFISTVEPCIAGEPVQSYLCNLLDVLRTDAALARLFRIDAGFLHQSSMHVSRYSKAINAQGGKGMRAYVCRKRV